MTNINDVAKNAGVSKGTVSRFLNDKPYVKKETKDRIIQVIKELNYKPSDIAISLKKKKTNTIGFIVEDISNPTAAEFCKIISNYLHELNYKLILMNKITGDSTDEYIDSLLGSRADGIITTAITIKDEYLKRIVDMNYPFVFLGASISNCVANAVLNDDYKGAYLITEHLLNLGHEKIAHITGGSIGGEVTINRHKGYLDALRDYKKPIKSEYIVEGDYTIEGGFNSTMKLICLNERPTAIFCANDYSAYGAIEAVLQKGLKVPENISLAGYDDTQLSSSKLINLTTVVLPKYDMARKAVGILMFKLKNKNNKKVFHFKLEPRLIIRNSTGVFKL